MPQYNRCGIYFKRFMRFDVITAFPEAFQSYLGVSILKRAIQRRLISIRFEDPRSFSRGRHHTIDDKPYGGGAGMVLMAEPILKAVAAALAYSRKSEFIYDRKYIRNRRAERVKIVILSAKGRQFNQRMAYGWAKRYDRLVIVSGRYEGIDERVRLVLKAQEISIGPYVLTDGDVAAMVAVSAVARLIPGVIKLESLKEESHWGALVKREAHLHARQAGGPGGQAGAKGLEYPHYTRPEVLRWRGRTYRVPRVLLSGDHQAIASWRSRHAR